VNVGGREEEGSRERWKQFPKIGDLHSEPPCDFLSRNSAFQTLFVF
jgi:hypothetical protein